MIGSEALRLNIPYVYNRKVYDTEVHNRIMLQYINNEPPSIELLNTIDIDSHVNGYSLLVHFLSLYRGTINQQVTITYLLSLGVNLYDTCSYKSYIPYTAYSNGYIVTSILLCNIRRVPSMYESYSFTYKP